MAHIVTQEDIHLLFQSQKEIFTKIELLNRQFKVLDELSGAVLGDSFNCDMESKQRRSFSCDIHVLNSTFLVGDDKKIWIDKYIRVYYGIRSERSKEIIWYLLGTFTYLDVNFAYSATASTLSLICGDLMADYDGTKGGVIPDYSLTIPAGEDIRRSVIALLKEAGITRYVVEDIKKEVPYDLEHTDAATYCDLWTELCGLYDSWEFFFDADGTFIWRRIPTGLADPCVLDDTALSGLVVDEKISESFQGIYNTTEIWGKVLELGNSDRYAESATYEENVYRVSFSEITDWDSVDNLTNFGFKAPAANAEGAKFQVNSLAPIPIVNDDGTPVKSGALKADTTYVFRYRRTLNGELQNSLYLLGQYQAHAVYEETNPDCPFSTTNLGYKIVQRLNFDNLYSDDLCYNQAEYSTYQSTAMLDTITLTCAVIPWLEVNQKIRYTPRETGETAQYIIKNISWSTQEGTMTMTLFKFLESFSYVKNRDNTKGRRL